ncbi:unnamed protein product [Amoebophrya sp. A25]|nr:unnamed protein product [Amoebophrya sp. A25]|eukprot:GSA25T00022974001.1
MPQELSARQRSLVHNESSIFSADGPHTGSIYNANRQREILSAVDEKKRVTQTHKPSIDVPTAREIKVAHSSGHNLVCGDGLDERHSRAEQLDVPPHERCGRWENSSFWEGSEAFRGKTRLTWTGKVGPPKSGPEISAAERKQRSGNSVVFGGQGQQIAGGSSPSGQRRTPHDEGLHAADAYFLTHQTKVSQEGNAASASDRFQKELHREHELRSQDVLQQAKRLEPAESERRKVEKNYSDIFGAAPPAPAKVGRREETTLGMGSWLDPKHELAYRNVVGHTTDAAMNISARERKNRNIFHSDSAITGSAKSRELVEQRRSEGNYTSAIHEHCPDGGMSQQAVLAREKALRIARQQGGAGLKEPLTHHGRNIAELSGHGYASQLTEKDYIGTLTERHNNVQQDQDHPGWTTHGAQKAYFGAKGEMYVTPDYDREVHSGGRTSSPGMEAHAIPDGKKHHATRKEAELRGSNIVLQ